MNLKALSTNSMGFTELKIKTRRTSLTTLLRFAGVVCKVCYDMHETGTGKFKKHFNGILSFYSAS